MKKIIYINWREAQLLVLLFIPLTLFANNIQVENVSLKATNPGAQYTHVAFDLSWENSWRLSTAPANWDAAWVFVKFRSQSGPWQHATLNYVNGTAANDGHTQPSGSTVTTVSGGIGAFIHRNADGTGDINWGDIQLRWNYGVDGVNNNAVLEVKVFAIEMVYVPQGSYLLGGGMGLEEGRFYQYGNPLNFTQSYQVNSEAAITVAPTIGNLYYLPGASSGNAGDQLGPIPAQFPKGYAAFYCMKYEVSQQQWIDFFETLTSTQKINNDITDLSHRGPNPIDRNTVDWEGTGGAVTTTPDVPLSFPEWGEVLAYCDWAGLRPMTELEFVKACRGSGPVVPSEYAWGSNDIISTSFIYDLLNKNEPNEIVVNHVASTGNANWINSAIFEDGPYRNGVFAASTTSTEREEVGATYYGIMEMSGNLSEMAITVGDPVGRAYKGIHGDGVLAPDGEANVATWPPVTGNADGDGGGLFGGSWFSQDEELRINDRRAATTGNIGYFNDVGFRCVRSAP